MLVLHKKEGRSPTKHLHELRLPRLIPSEVIDAATPYTLPPPVVRQKCRTSPLDAALVRLACSNFISTVLPGCGI